MISFRIQHVCHVRKRMCHFTGYAGPLLHVSMQRLDTFWTWRSCECAVCHGSHGTVGDSASWVVEAPRIALESADLCHSPSEGDLASRVDPLEVRQFTS